MTWTIKENVTALAWLAAALVLWVAALLLGENLLGMLSLFSGGMGVAGLVRTWLGQLKEGGERTGLRREEKTELLERLADAELENARLRAEADFDRELRSGGQQE